MLFMLKAFLTSALGEAAVFAVAAAIVMPAADDWPQMLGPTRDGVYAGAPLAETWPASGPAIVWKRDVGQGFSGPVVAGGRVILFHRVGSREVVEALDPTSGTSLWKYDYSTTYRDDFGFDEGPRAVPVVAGGIVYTFGAEGVLSAIDVEKGTRVWSQDTRRRFEVPKNFFGAGGSPIVDDGRVIANIGGIGAGIVAFDATTGKMLWTATSDEASYSSGTMATIAGRRLAIFLTRNGLVGLDPASGRVQFQRTWRSRSASSVNAATPLVIGNDVFVSAQYGPGAGVLRAVNNTLTDVWTSDDALSTHYATAVYRDGVLYGYHGRQETGPSLRAVDFKSGRVLWSVDQFRAGSITLAGDRLVIVRESGELVIAAAAPDAFKVLARATILPRRFGRFPRSPADISICATTRRSSASICGAAGNRARGRLPRHPRRRVDLDVAAVDDHFSHAAHAGVSGAGVDNRILCGDVLGHPLRHGIDADRRGDDLAHAAAERRAAVDDQLAVVVAEAVLTGGTRFDRPPAGVADLEGLADGISPRRAHVGPVSREYCKDRPPRRRRFASLRADVEHRVAKCRVPRDGRQAAQQFVQFHQRQPERRHLHDRSVERSQCKLAARHGGRERLDEIPQGARDIGRHVGGLEPKAIGKDDH